MKAKSQLGLKFVSFDNNKYQASWFTDRKDYWILTSKDAEIYHSMLIPAQDFEQLTHEIEMDTFNVLDYEYMTYNGEPLVHNGEPIYKDLRWQ